MYNRESKIMRKLLGKAASDTTTGDSSSVAGTATPIPSSFRPSKSQDAVYAAGCPISCFDVSSDRRAVVLAGPHILKTVVVKDPASLKFAFRDSIDVRAIINTRHSAGSRSNAIADQLNIRDVKWHSGSFIYTACASGKVFSYDLTRLGSGEAEPLEHVLMHEDSRQINSLAINPHLQSWLLTGGQDGTARVFDSNSPTPARHGVTFRQRFAPLRCIDPIRQVSWSPKQGYEMACCTESGAVMKWDVRQPSRPMLRISAHENSCSTIAWHPDGIHLMSAGFDTKIQVWDLGHTADKRQKPKFTISTPAPVVAIAWRPGLWSASARARRTAQVAVTYDETSSRRYGTSAVHIWDFARPSMPYKEIDSFETCPSAIWWQDQEMLWTAGQDGTFCQRDVAFARKVVDRHSTSAMAFSPRGDALLFLEERSKSNRLRFHETHPTEMMQRATYGSSPGNSGGMSSSRSDSEDDVLGSFLGRHRMASRKSTQGGRGGAPLSTTPPSGGASFPDDGKKQSLDLEQSINITGTFKPQQAMSFGHMPAAMSVQVYHFMSRAYLETLKQGLPYVEGGKDMAERVGDMMEQFARASEVANLHRLAQTWRILALAMDMILKRRAQDHFEVRVGQFRKMHLDEGSSRRPGGLKKPSETFGDGQDTPRRLPAQRGSDGRFHPVRSLLAEEIESTSGVATPVARSADGGGSGSTSGFGPKEASHYHGKRPSPMTQPESLSLEGPAAHESSEKCESRRKRLDAEPTSGGGSGRRPGESESSCTEGHDDSHDTRAPAKAIDVPMTRSRNMGQGGAGASSSSSSVAARHDLDSSLGQMFSISSGTRKPVRMGSSGDAFARPGPGLARERSDSERGSGASSQDSAAISVTSTEKQVFTMAQTTKTDESYPGPSSLTVTSDGTNGDDSSTSPHVWITGTGSHGRHGRAKREPTSPRHDPRPRIVETDYLPWEQDEPPGPRHGQGGGGGAQQDHRGGGGAVVSSISPMEPYGVLLRALDFESKTSALHASAMMLLLKPLVADSVIDTHRATAILRQHHRRLMQMSLFVEAALVRNMCLQGWPEGLPDWGQNYESIFSDAQQGGKIGVLCTSCRKPREADPEAGVPALWMCERCRSVMAPCPVCGHREVQRPSHIPEEVAPSASDVESEAWLSEWCYCPVCAHGGHASCLHLWHGASEASLLADPSTKYSDGCCPSDGCGHACLPGKYRGELAAARSDELGRAAIDSARAREERAKSGGSRVGSRVGSRAGSRRSSPGAPLDRGVRSDGNDVPQSRAVSVAREALNKSSSSSSGGGILSSSPGRTAMTSAGGDRERRKSVKFARQSHG